LFEWYATATARLVRSAKDPRIGRKRKRDSSQLVHPHPAGNGYRHHLHNADCPLANVVAAKIGCLTVGDQFAETSGLVPVNLTMAAEQD
jgi:primase-polymerase (primpol)-like protein